MNARLRFAIVLFKILIIKKIISAAVFRISVEIEEKGETRLTNKE